LKKNRFKEEMSYLLPHLRSGWAVDQAILRCVTLTKLGNINIMTHFFPKFSEESRVVVIRFGHDWDTTCTFNK
jgi:DIM1 family U5 snRNP protein